jgi:hypothetical protein
VEEKFLMPQRLMAKRSALEIRRVSHGYNYRMGWMLKLERFSCLGWGTEWREGVNLLTSLLNVLLLHSTILCTYTTCTKEKWAAITTFILLSILT